MTKLLKTLIFLIYLCVDPALTVASVATNMRLHVNGLAILALCRNQKYD